MGHPARLSEAQRLFWHIFDLEHELEIGGHNDGWMDAMDRVVELINRMTDA